MADVTHTFILNKETVNSYGYRVLTGGIDLTAFLKNPIMLWNHTRAAKDGEDAILPIGRWENVRKENGQLIADAVFDETDPFAVKIANKVKAGILRSCSLGFSVVDSSDIPSLLLNGQTRATVTKSILKEVSIVDIPGNQDCCRLYDDDFVLLSADKQNNVIPLIVNNSMTPNNEIQTLAAELGLPNTANMGDVQYEVKQLKAKVAESERAEKTRKNAEIDTLLNSAVADQRLHAKSTQDWRELFESNFDKTKAALEKLPTPTKFSSIPSQASNGNEESPKYKGKTFLELSKENPKALEELKQVDVNFFKQLYKSSYGIDWKG